MIDYTNHNAYMKVIVLNFEINGPIRARDHHDGSMGSVDMPKVS